jgi:hypothetical protein
LCTIDSRKRREAADIYDWKSRNFCPLMNINLLCNS